MRPRNLGRAKAELLVPDTDGGKGSNVARPRPRPDMNELLHPSSSDAESMTGEPEVGAPSRTDRFPHPHDQ